MVARVERFVPRDGAQVAACVRRAADAVCRRRGRGRGVSVVTGVVRFLPRDGLQVAACVWRAAGAVCRRHGGERGGGHGGGGGAVCPAGQCASCGLCLSCLWCFLSAWRWRTWRWTWWRGWCGLSRGTLWKLRLVFVEQLVLVVGVAAAEVAMDVVVVAAVRFVPRHGLRGPTCFASWASWRRSEWRPLAGLGT